MMVYADNTHLTRTWHRRNNPLANFIGWIHLLRMKWVAMNAKRLQAFRYGIEDPCSR